MKDCPQCGQKNLNAATNCECGYLFSKTFATDQPSSIASQSSTPPLVIPERTEEIQENLTFWESIFTVFYGAILGLLLGLIFMWFQTSRFKSDGHVLKVKKSWQLYWFAFGARLAFWIILITIYIAKPR